MPEPGAHRILIVATEAVVGQGISEVLAPHLRDGANQAFVVAPALAGSALKHAMGDVDEAKVEAQSTLDLSLANLQHERLEVLGGTIGDSDPVLAIQDALVGFPADQIVIVTRAEDESRWLEGDTFDRARTRFEPEIVHVSLEHDGGDADNVEDVERSGRGLDEQPGAGLDTASRNMPKLSARDLAGIAIALIGTIILVVLAGTCEGSEVQRDAGTDGAGTEGNCVAVYIIAGITALVNLAHVVGLVLFQSVGYRGGFERLFANMSLYGTPLAIVAALLIR